MQSNIKEYYDLILGELQKAIDGYKIVVDTDKEIAKEVEDIKKFILDTAENAGSDAASETDFIKKGTEKIAELQDKLNNAYRLVRWKNKQDNIDEHSNYIFTDNLNRLHKELKRLDKSCVDKFKDRLDAIRKDFKLEQNRDSSKFEAANNRQTNTKERCEKALYDNGKINGIAWEIKCTSGTTAARFAAIQDITNTRWFIYSQPYSHKDNAGNAHNAVLVRAAEQYCKNINNLEAIPENIVEDYYDVDEYELSELAEQLRELLEL